MYRNVYFGGGRRRLSREDRKRQIVKIAMWHTEHTQKELTVARFARVTGMRPSSHLRAILNEMVQDGWLVVYTAEHRSNVVKRVYQLGTIFNCSCGWFGPGPELVLVEPEPEHYMWSCPNCGEVIR